MNNQIQICPRNKQYVNFIACAANCSKKCSIYIKNVSYDKLEKYVNEHPEYEIIGVLMPKKTKRKTRKKDNVEKKEKICWVIDSNNKVTKARESEILENPKDYMDKKIVDIPTYKYDLVISLKRSKAKENEIID